MSDVKIYVLHCGTITLDEKVAFGTKHPQLMKVKAQLTPERKRITLPNCAYLVVSKSGLVLIDTGWSRDISPNGVPDADAATDFTSAFIWNLYHGHVGPGQTAMEKLAAMGIRPEDLNCVLFTTLVAERCCAIRDFSERTRLIVAQEESFYSYRHGAFHATYLYSDLPELEQYYFIGTMEGPAWRSLDLFEDGTFELVSTPGHTKGTIAVKVHNKKGQYALLTSDTAFTRRNVDNLEVPAFSNLDTMRLRSLEWLKQEAEKPQCKYVFAPHDPDIPEGVYEF